MHQREELAVSSGTKSFKIFLDMAENSLLLLSRNPSIINPSTETQKALDEFALDWAETPILGAARFDKDGNFRFMGNNVGESGEIYESLIGDVSSRDYFVWAETATEGDVYLGKPLMPKVKSPNLQFIFPFITPIYKSGDFDGILVLAISLPKLTAAYLDPLEVSPNCRVYLMHPDGTILAGSSEYAELIQFNYFEYLRDNPYPGSEAALQGLTQAVESENEGRLDVILYSPIEKGLVRFIIAYSPVIYGNEHWTLGLAVPITNINNDFDPLRETSIMLFSSAVLFILTLSAMGILLARANQRKAYLEGLEDGKRSKS